MILIFPTSGHVDWHRVREHCSGGESSPLLIDKDQPQFADDFAGSYAWVQPGPGGWAADGSNWGEVYFENLYKTVQNEHPDKFAVGGAWPGLTTPPPCGD
jgi:hypothetical protein